MANLWSIILFEEGFIQFHSGGSDLYLDLLLRIFQNNETEDLDLQNG